ncbi:MAG TPA: L,D-transpeptidase family protein [Hyphomicrobium sp.]
MAPGIVPACTPPPQTCLFDSLEYVFNHPISSPIEQRLAALGEAGGAVVRKVGKAEAVFALVGAVAVAGATLGASAQDLRFGPVGDGPSASSDGFDRSFIREWQANPPKGFPTASKTNLAPTKAAIARYTGIVANGGFVAVPEGEMEPGLTHEAVGLLRQRLLASGELREDTSYPTYFGTDLEKAVKRFQASNGLAPTGIVDKRTIAALNVPADVRLKQLKENLTRLTDLSRLVGMKRYVLVNIPAAQIEVIERDTVVSRHSGVVGKPDRPTPLLRSTISELNFNPIWTLPPTVIKEDLIPKGQEMQKSGQSVLLKYGIDAYDGSGRKLKPESINWSSAQPLQLSFRQAPGKENPLGFLKINFANSNSVYMHDSPKESLFGRNFRAASSGCVRVQNIEQLATWLLQGQGGWNEYHVERIKESGERRNVRLKRPVPLYFVYVTAWATEDGVVQFRPDVYLKDGVGEIAAAY